jgi:hypothetical protein
MLPNDYVINKYKILLDVARQTPSVDECDLGITGTNTAGSNTEEICRSFVLTYIKIYTHMVTPIENDQLLIDLREYRHIYNKYYYYYTTYQMTWESSLRVKRIVRIGKKLYSF